MFEVRHERECGTVVVTAWAEEADAWEMANRLILASLRNGTEEYVRVVPVEVAG